MNPAIFFQTAIFCITSRELLLFLNELVIDLSHLQIFLYLPLSKLFQLVFGYD